MFSHILVPLDGTAESNAALPLARTVAQTSGGTITLLRVLQPNGEADGDEVAEQMRRVATELGDSVPSVTTVVREAANVAREILEQVRALSADLVIMRTRGRAGIGRAMLGSVTQDVLANCPVPVMLMRPGGRRITHIRQLLVPVDGSPGGALSLGLAVQLSRATNASIRLLEVSVPASNWVFTSQTYNGMSYYDPAWDEEALEAARTYVDGLVSRLRAAGVTAEGEARQTSLVPDTIVTTAEAARVDLIVMSTRAHTGPARALLGSTADAVVRAADCPVLLIHRRDDATDPLEALDPHS